MGTLAVDIETASPHEEPPPGSNETRYFEWLAVAVAYSADEDEGDPETEVLFRRGGWDDEHTADLLDRFVDWCRERDAERTLTYNGTYFDLTHMLHWAEALAASGERPDAVADLTAALPTHVDVALAARDAHEDELWESQSVLPAWKAYQLEGIEDTTVWYDDYDFNPDVFEGLGIEDRMVKGVHVGQVLGARYVEGVEAGLAETSTHRELRRLLTDYGRGDVADLYRLYRALGGPALDERYGRPVAAVER
jgi:hypothetical protein